MSCYCYSKVSTYSNIDGKINSSVTEKKQIDDKYVTTKTIIDENGEKTITTDYHNIDENELPDFDKNFSKDDAIGYDFDLPMLL